VSTLAKKLERHPVLKLSFFINIVVCDSLQRRVSSLISPSGEHKETLRKY